MTIYISRLSVYHVLMEVSAPYSASQWVSDFDIGDGGPVTITDVRKWIEEKLSSAQATDALTLIHDQISKSLTETLLKP